jgi:hypothetical protein
MFSPLWSLQVGFKFFVLYVNFILMFFSPKKKLPFFLILCLIFLCSILVIHFTDFWISHNLWGPKCLFKSNPSFHKNDKNWLKTCGQLVVWASSVALSISRGAHKSWTCSYCIPRF